MVLFSDVVRVFIMAASTSGLKAASPCPPPSTRKCCEICEKFVYLHQPVLMCCECGDIFHGKCLNFNNNTIFKLQQTDWYCSVCSNDQNSLKCHCCKVKINLNCDKFEICKNCQLPTHENSCLFEKLCLLCIPNYEPDTALYDCDYSIDINKLETADFQQNGQPYFTPFELINNNATDGIVDPHEAYENISINSTILQTCEYYDINKLSKICNVFDKEIKTFSTLGLNIDGLKSNL